MLAIIGGSGLSKIREKSPLNEERVTTPFGSEAIAVDYYQFGSQQLAFLARHGPNGAIPPHRVNYRANIWALHELGHRRVLGINVVGGIHPEMAPGAIMVPDQLIDYTQGRPGTFYEEGLERAVHIDFTEPFDPCLRAQLLEQLERLNAGHQERRTVLDRGVYGCTQGPRLETAAEIRRLQRDGCDIVGMTAMPEAALARELGMAYALLTLSVNWAAGLDAGEISMEAIGQMITEGMEFVLPLLEDWQED